MKLLEALCMDVAPGSELCLGAWKRWKLCIRVWRLGGLGTGLRKQGLYKGLRAGLGSRLYFEARNGWRQ
jgi:hypothetical protein